ncbi:MAG TPA: ABC transporter substrate-binding protein [Gaiellaceae bacterium]|jgi:iron complex transport system substrate-binding protein|nr:ABC transporter substrate-binding protein [Gaiellaceae bacterium]
MKKLGTPRRLAVLLAALALVVVTAAAAAPKSTTVPDRIVSLSPSSTDDLFAIGAGKQVVAVDSYSTYPKQAPTTKLSAYTPNVEAIAKYKPDLVVLSGDTNHIVEQLAKLHIKSIIEPAAANLNGVYAELKQLGTVTGHPAGAKNVVARMQRQIKAIVASAPRPATPLTVYHELDQTYYSATSHTFIGQLYTLLGLKNIADKAGGASDYPQLSDEYIIASNPDLIVLADTVCCGQTLATVKARPGWNTITAVKRGDVVRIDDSIASQWGARVVSFLKAIASGLKTLEAQSK